MTVMDTIHELDLEEWRRASAAVAKGRIIELGRVFQTQMPHYPTHPDFEVALFRKHGDRVRGDGASSASCHWSFGGHTGTHIDALCHVSHCGAMFDGTPVDNERLERGEADGDAAQLAPYIRRGVLFDIAALNGVATLDGDHVVTADEMERAAHLHDLDVKPGDVALIRTGWARHWETGAYIAEETPGPGLNAGTWLADRCVGLVGSDTAVFEKGPVTEAAPVHRLMLMERRIHIMENLDLEGLAEAQVHSFLFLALPLRTRGATASPLRPVAVC
ncbi:cyclase family protein [Oricola sp.]|uniref:cyclase family protein n=1 Tax=Oricola sp. TaxID=1979950 RepID=UPI0025D086F6|nr:cyclase family protein [Oricola sp.]MCI5074189.1 cyclase family protein [Oricola sp.]